MLKLFIPAVPFNDLRNMNRYGLRNLVFLVILSSAVACITYAADVWFFSFQKFVPLSLSTSPSDASFLEGIVFLLCGVLALIGSGGISATTRKAAVLAAAASAMGKDVISPSEVYKRDAWKPKGFTRLGLTLIMAGVILLIVYFVSI